MKVVTTLSHRFGQTINVGESGEVSFDENGIAEVSEEQAASLFSETDTIAPYEGTVDSQEDESHDLGKLTVKELKQIAVDAELPEAEWNSLKKDDLVQYLVDNIKD
jgi:hypothetical protein